MTKAPIFELAYLTEACYGPVIAGHIHTPMNMDNKFYYTGSYSNWMFGDGENDIEMLATVGCGIAMGNAAENVKRHAKQVTDSVSQDGVARGIGKYILCQKNDEYL